MDAPWLRLVSMRECSDGHQRPHSLVLCCGNTLFGTLASTPLTLVFLQIRPPLRLHDKAVSAPGLPSPRRMTSGVSTAGREQGWPDGGRPVLLGRHLRGPYLRQGQD